MIKELERMGFKVTARRRSDGGMIITKINNMTFTGAKGNNYARQVLGVELSQARLEQTSYNVEKYIKNVKKVETLDEDMKKKLRRVQRQWRKRDVQRKITAKKVKRHIKESGRKEATEYLEKMERYGKGLAYADNVEWLAKYTEDLAQGYLIDDNTQNRLYQLADYIRSRIDDFKEAWISEVYQRLYEINEQHNDPARVNALIDTIYSIIK